MIADFVRTARDHLTGRYVLSLVAFLALVYGVTQDIEMVVAIALGLAFVETISILRDAPTVDSRWVGVGLGAFITVASLAWFAWELTAAAETGGPAWFPALTALIGVWFLFDARTDFDDGTDSYAPDDMDPAFVGNAPPVYGRIASVGVPAVAVQIGSLLVTLCLLVVVTRTAFSIAVQRFRNYHIG